jgi:hypothetical protein
MAVKHTDASVSTAVSTFAEETSVKPWFQSVSIMQEWSMEWLLVDIVAKDASYEFINGISSKIPLIQCLIICKSW